MIKKTETIFIIKKEKASKPFLLYFTLLLVYFHAIACVPLDYYLPHISKLLPLMCAIILNIYLYVFIFWILVKRYHINSTIFLFLIYIFICLLSFINLSLYYGAINFAPVIVGFYRGILPISFVFMAYFSIKNIWQGYKLFRLIVWINTSIAIIGLITYLLPKWWLVLYSQFSKQVGGIPLHFGGVLRMSSILWFPLYFGMLMSLNSIMIWNIIQCRRRIGIKWFIVYIISVIGVIASFTRTAWLALFIGTIIPSFFLFRMIPRRFMKYLVVFLVTIVVILNMPLHVGNYNTMIDAILSHIESSFKYDKPKPRIEDLKVNIPRIVKYPIVYGLGTAGHATQWQIVSASSMVFKEHSANDNNYLSIMLQVGVQGLIIFMLAHIVALKQIVQKLRKSKYCREQIILGTTIG